MSIIYRIHTEAQKVKDVLQTAFHKVCKVTKCSDF